MKNKLYTMEDLSLAMDNYKRQKTIVDDRQKDLKVLDGKCIQLKKELEEAEKLLYKEEKLILDIIGDLEIGSKNR